MLYLHIGSGKAGSTTIQKFLRENRGRLPYRQLDAFGIGNSWKLAAATGTQRCRAYWVDQRKRFSPDAYGDFCTGFWPQVEAEFARLEPADYVASTEYLHAYIEQDPDAMKRLRDGLVGLFGTVRIIVYLRNQIDFVKSVYAQRVKGPTRETLSFADYIAALDRIGVDIDYAGQLRAWCDVFGRDNIDAVVFDRRNFPNGNLIADFCARIGIDHDQDRLPVRLERANVSPSYAHLTAYRWLNRARLEGWPRRHLEQAVDRLLPDRGFPAHYDTMLLRRVSEGNHWLNTTFFADMPARLPECAADR